MSFKRAFYAMLEGKKVKRPTWEGYWAWENETIIMHCAAGIAIDIRETDSVRFTVSNMIADDWIAVE